MEIVLPILRIMLELAAATSSAAELPRGHHPQICVGFQPAEQVWAIRDWDSLHLCDQNYAFYSTYKPGGRRPSPSTLEINAACCPLPAEDILTDSHALSVDNCPPDTVATGMVPEKVENRYVYKVRCTRINTDRYKLGPATEGAVWGASTAAAFPWRETEVLKPADIPAAIRAGVTRKGKFEFFENGCVGTPPGSLIVRKYTKKCRDYHFRQLLFRGAAGDPPQDTPVEMFPPCRYVKDIFATHPECEQ